MGQGEGNQYKYEKYDITGFIFQKQYGHFHPEQETFFFNLHFGSRVDFSLCLS